MYNPNQRNDNDTCNAPALLKSLEQRELSICNIGILYPEVASSTMSTAATTVTTATPSVTATTTSSSSSSFRIPTTLNMESAANSSNSMINNSSNHLYTHHSQNYPRSTSISRGDGRYHLRRSTMGPSTQSIQIFNFSNRVNNNNNNSNSNSSSTNNNSSSNENPNSNHNTDSIRWGGSSMGSHKLLFTLNDSIASFAASPAPLMHHFSNTYHQPIDEDCTNSNYNSSKYHSDVNNTGNKNISNIISSTNHPSNKSNHVKMSRRPSVFTTLSGSRYYMDETKGEPIPVPASITHPSATAGDGMDPHTEQIRRQSSQLTLISTLSSVAFQDEAMHLQQNRPATLYPPPSTKHHHHHHLDGSSSHRGSYGGPLPPQPSHSLPKFRNPMMQPHYHQQSLPHDSHHSQQHVIGVPPQRRSSITGGKISSSLKSVVMIDRIPPPIPPQPPYIRGIEMNCKMDILSTPIGRRYIVQHRQLNGTNDRSNKSNYNTSVFVVGTPMISSDSSTNGLSSSRHIPYNSYLIECPNCQDAMIVSKYCIVVQCPHCHTISPCEATKLSITKPRTLQNATTTTRHMDSRM